jgi:hypothetical protein
MAIKSKGGYQSRIDERMFHGHQIVDSMSNHVFGASSWFHFFGVRIWECGVPPIPESLQELVLTPCPFLKGKKIKHTHFLFLSPTDRYDSLCIPRIGKVHVEGILKTLEPLHECFGFKQQRIHMKWYLMPIGGIRTNSFSNSKIPKNYVVAPETEEMWKMVLYKLRVDRKKGFPFVHSLIAKKIGPCGSVDFQKLHTDDHRMIGTKDGLIVSEKIPKGTKIPSYIPVKRIIGA